MKLLFLVLVAVVVVILWPKPSRLVDQPPVKPAPGTQLTSVDDTSDILAAIESNPNLTLAGRERLRAKVVRLRNLQVFVGIKQAKPKHQ